MLITTGLERLLSAAEETKPLSALYSHLVGMDTSKVSQLFLVWQGDIPSLVDDNWEEGIQQYLPLVISARDRFVQLKILHRAYFSPQRLAKIYRDSNSLCPKCTSEEGSFFHVVWACRRIQTFWREVVATVSSVSGLSVQCDPIPLSLGVVDNLAGPKSKKLFVFYAAFYARKVILLQWKGPTPSPQQFNNVRSS